MTSWTRLTGVGQEQGKSQTKLNTSKHFKSNITCSFVSHVQSLQIEAGSCYQYNTVKYNFHKLVWYTNIHNRLSKLIPFKLNDFVISNCLLLFVCLFFSLQFFLFISVSPTMFLTNLWLLVMPLMQWFHFMVKEQIV